MKVQLTQFALKKLDLVVDEFWAEISDSIQTIEVVSSHRCLWVRVDNGTNFAPGGF